MAPATVVSSVHCCAGAPQRFGRPSVIILMAHIQRAESVHFMQTLFSPGNLFKAFHLGISICMAGLNKAVVLFIHSEAIGVLSLI